jgi:hypothetical protein
MRDPRRAIALAGRSSAAGGAARPGLRRRLWWPSPPPLSYRPALTCWAGSVPSALPCPPLLWALAPCYVPANVRAKHHRVRRIGFPVDSRDFHTSDTSSIRQRLCFSPFDPHLTSLAFRNSYCIPVPGWTLTRRASLGRPSVIQDSVRKSRCSLEPVFGADGGGGAP